MLDKISVTDSTSTNYLILKINVIELNLTIIIISTIVTAEVK